MKTKQPGERTTVTLSTLVAIALLGAVVTAQPAGSPTVDRLASLESDLRYQLDLAYRHDGASKRQRLAAVDAAIEAYRHSPQGDEESRRFAGWMRESILRSLPGDLRELPPTPTFEAPAATEEAATATAENDATQPDAEHPDDALPDDAEPSAEATAAAPADDEAEPATPTRADEDAVAPAPEPATTRAAAELATPPVAKPAMRSARATGDSPPAGAGAVERAPQVPVVEINQPNPPATEPASTASAPAPPVLEKSITVRKPVPAATAQLVAGEALVDITTAKNAVVPPAAKPAAASIAVNLAELNARIDGYHVGLDEIDAAVVAGRDNITYEQVARLVTRVEELAFQYEFLRLYYDALTEAERRKVAEPRSLTATIALVEQQRSGLPPAGGGDFLEAVEQEGEEDELARRLRTAAAAVAE